MNWRIKELNMATNKPLLDKIEEMKVKWWHKRRPNEPLDEIVAMLESMDSGQVLIVTRNHLCDHIKTFMDSIHLGWKGAARYFYKKVEYRTSKNIIYPMGIILRHDYAPTDFSLTDSLAFDIIYEAKGYLWNDMKGVERRRQNLKQQQQNKRKKYVKTSNEQL